MYGLCWIWYCWWNKSYTTWDVQNPVNNGINYQPQLVSRIVAGFLPSTVSPTFGCFFLVQRWSQGNSFFSAEKSTQAAHAREIQLRWLCPRRYVDILIPGLNRHQPKWSKMWFSVHSCLLIYTAWSFVDNLGDFFITCGKDGEVNLIRTETCERIGTQLGSSVWWGFMLLNPFQFQGLFFSVQSLCYFLFSHLLGDVTRFDSNIRSISAGCHQSLIAQFEPSCSFVGRFFFRHNLLFPCHLAHAEKTVRELAF